MISNNSEIIITIIRQKSPIGTALLGKFSCDGFTGHTLEDNGLKIGNGIFKGKIYLSPKSKRTVITLDDNDTKRKNIQIRNGNYTSHSGGSILVGDSTGKDPKNTTNGAVWNSVNTLNSLINKCKGKNLTIIIKTDGSNNDNSDCKYQNDDKINIDRVFVIRRKLSGIIKIRAVSHSGLLLVTKTGDYYILEYSKAKRTDLYPVDVEIITTYHTEYYEDIKIAGCKWTKQLNGAKPNRLWTINEAKKEMEKQLKDIYAIFDNKCCHIAQQKVRQAMGIKVKNPFDINKHPNVQKAFEYAGV